MTGINPFLDLDNNQLRMLRFMLSQQRLNTPTLKAAPVQSVGEGFSQGINNVMNLFFQRQSQKKNLENLNTMLAGAQAQKKEAELKEMNTRREALLGLGVSDASANAGAVDKVVFQQTVDKHIKQLQKNKEFNQRLEATQQLLPEPFATVFATNGLESVQKVFGPEITKGLTIQNLMPLIQKQMSGEALSLAENNLFRILQGQNTLTKADFDKAVSEAQKAGVDAKFAGPLAQAQLNNLNSQIRHRDISAGQTQQGLSLKQQEQQLKLGQLQAQQLARPQYLQEFRRFELGQIDEQQLLSNVRAIAIGAGEDPLAVTQQAVDLIESKGFKKVFSEKTPLTFNLPGPAPGSIVSAEDVQRQFQQGNAFLPPAAIAQNDPLGQISGVAPLDDPQVRVIPQGGLPRPGERPPSATVTTPTVGQIGQDINTGINNLFRTILPFDITLTEDPNRKRTR